MSPDRRGPMNQPSLPTKAFLPGVLRAVAAARPPRLPSWVGVLCAPAATLLAFLTQIAVLPHPHIAPFVFFFFGVALAAWLAGRAAGLAAVGLSALVANYCFVQAHWGWAMSTPALTATGLFAVSASAIAVLCGSLRDALEQSSRSEASARRGEEFNRRIIESSHDCIKVLDLDGNLLSVSPGGQHLLEIDDLASVLNTSWVAFWRDVHLEAAVAALATAKAGGMGRFQGYCPTAKGTPRWWDVVVTPIAGADGKPERLLAVSRDVTERRQMEEALREADRRKDEFLAVLSHELRGPLAPIRNSVYLLEHAPPGGEQARRAQQIIDRQSAHLSRLVDDLLDLNRISRGKVELQRERVDLAELVQRTAEDHRAHFIDRGVGLQVEVTHAPLWLDADQTRIAQVIGNLLGNASKFTSGGSRGGSVHVQVTVEHSQAVVRVRDTGVGIAPELLAKIFDPFTQAEQTLARSQGGLGLGLALVKGFVEMHGGTVSAASDGPGLGAEFAIRLPLLQRVMPDELRPAAITPGRRLRLVVIEDNRDAAESLRDVLAFLGHEAQLAYDGASGLAAVRAMRPDMVLCDIGLPDMDGYAVARSLRSDPQLAACQLVALTGYAQPEDLAKATAAGFDRHLAKPPSLEKIKEVLAK